MELSRVWGSMMPLAPEVQLIAIRRSNGCVAIMQFVTKQQRNGSDPGWEREPTDDAIEAEIGRSGIVDCIGWARVTPESLPVDRTFRGAWGHDGANIFVDMERAREIYRSRVRQDRAPKLAKLDVEYQRADERGDAQSKLDIASQKQKLRDAPSDVRITAASTPEELNAIDWK